VHFLYQCDDGNIGQSVLQDVKKGKPVEWREHKINSLKLAASYERLHYESKYIRVCMCAEFLEFESYENGEKKLKSVNFCKVRLCPMCAWRRSLKVFGQVSKVMNYLDANHDYRYIFATFTVKNVFGEQLPCEMDKLFKAFNLMTKRKEFKSVSKGWFRCLEVTHNWEREDYHPHFHVVIAVDKWYFKETKNYLNHDAWVRLWKSCLGVDYDPIVNVKAVKQNADGTYGKAVAEVAKYAAKPSDYLLEVKKCSKELIENNVELREAFEEYQNKKTDEAVEVMDVSLHKRRLIAFGGVFKDVHKKLNLDDTVDGDLIKTDTEDEIRQDLNYVLVRYNWNVGYKNYIRSK
jgi:plasmid rolling circle replication initiator protein Rep